jgi:hypothetical protein
LFFSIWIPYNNQKVEKTNKTKNANPNRNRNNSLLELKVGLTAFGFIKTNQYNTKTMGKKNRKG